MQCQNSENSNFGNEIIVQVPWISNEPAFAVYICPHVRSSFQVKVSRMIKPAQVKRDRHRAETFRTTVADKSTLCLETYVNFCPGVQTRRMAVINGHDSYSIASDIEVMRHEQSLSSELDILASPFVPEAQQMISLEDRVYVPSVHYDSPDTASPDVLTDRNMDQDNTTTCTETETQHSMDITTTDMDSGEETGREDMSRW